MELWLVLAISMPAILFALFLVKNVLARDTGTSEMQTISDAIKEGAEALRRAISHPSSQTILSGFNARNCLLEDTADYFYSLSRKTLFPGTGYLNG